MSDPNAVPTPAGLLIIDKQPGFTSMDVCAIVRTRLRRGGAPKRIKVGHGGTLDPMATGVLVLMIGKATRLCEQIMGDQKEYHATIDLAHRSTTDDAEGLLTPVEASHVPTLEELRQVAARFVGTIQQLPPGHSAMRVGGMRAYHFARRGEAPPIQPRPVRIDAIDVLSYRWPIVHLRVACGKGAYIRSLARDLGALLGAGGMLRSLRRTRVGACAVEQAVPFDDLPRTMGAEHLSPVGLLQLAV